MEKTETAFCNGGMCYLRHEEHAQQAFLKLSGHHSRKLICHGDLYTGGLGSKATLAFRRTYVQTDKMGFRMNIKGWAASPKICGVAFLHRCCT